MRKLLAVVVVLLCSGWACIDVVAQTVTEDRLRSQTRRYTGRQVFDLMGGPPCSVYGTDPPPSGCAPRDTCFSYVNDQVYHCKNGTWTVFGEGVATISLSVPGEETQIQFKCGETLCAAEFATYEEATERTSVKKLNKTIYAFLYATAGSGTRDDRWILPDDLSQQAIDESGDLYGGAVQVYFPQGFYYVRKHGGFLSDFEIPPGGAISWRGIHYRGDGKGVTELMFDPAELENGPMWWYDNFSGKCSSTTTQFCELDGECPGAERCVHTHENAALYVTIEDMTLAGSEWNSSIPLGGVLKCADRTTACDADSDCTGGQGRCIEENADAGEACDDDGDCTAGTEGTCEGAWWVRCDEDDDCSSDTLNYRVCTSHPFQVCLSDANCADNAVAATCASAEHRCSTTPFQECTVDATCTGNSPSGTCVPAGGNCEVFAAHCEERCDGSFGIHPNANGIRIHSDGQEQSFNINRVYLAMVERGFEAHGTNTASEIKWFQSTVKGVGQYFTYWNNNQAIDYEFSQTDIHEVYGDVFRVGPNSGGKARFYSGFIRNYPNLLRPHKESWVLSAPYLPVRVCANNPYTSCITSADCYASAACLGNHPFGQNQSPFVFSGIQWEGYTGDNTAPVGHTGFINIEVGNPSILVEGVHMLPAYINEPRDIVRLAPLGAAVEMIGNNVRSPDRYCDNDPENNLPCSDDSDCDVGGVCRNVHVYFRVLPFSNISSNSGRINIRGGIFATNLNRQWDDGGPQTISDFLWTATTGQIHVEDVSNTGFLVDTDDDPYPFCATTPASVEVCRPDYVAIDMDLPAPFLRTMGDANLHPKRMLLQPSNGRWPYWDHVAGEVVNERYVVLPQRATIQRVVCEKPAQAGDSKAYQFEVWTGAGDLLARSLEKPNSSTDKVSVRQAVTLGYLTMQRTVKLTVSTDSDVRGASSHVNGASGGYCYVEYE